MMRSMFSGVSGLRVHQTKMDVIAHNIANVNTVGYKSSRVTFSEVFSQTVSSASSANENTGRGGVNPMQIGLGANIGSIDKVMTTGAAQRTDNPFDIMIQGEGFFIVGDNSGQYFTRAGALNIDKAGNLVNSTGLTVLGWDAIKDNTAGSKTEGQYVIQQGNVKPIQITGEKEYVNPSSTTLVKLEGNLNADTKPKYQSSMDLYDSVGNKYTVATLFEYVPGATTTNTGNAYWKMSIANLAYPNGVTTNGGYKVDIATGTPLEIKIGAKQPADAKQSFTDETVTPATGRFVATIKFDKGGLLADVTTGTGAAQPTAAPANTPPLTELKFKVVTDPVNPATTTPESKFGDANSEVTFKFGELRAQANVAADAKLTKLDGNKPGTLVGVNIGPDGKITGRYSNGDLRVLSQIPVAQFANPAGLEKVGNNLFVTTANSGDFNGIGEEVSSGGGQMMGGVLEMSNVDLAQEFTEMITTQRGFQANSRTITTSDELLQELVNLKR